MAIETLTTTAKKYYEDVAFQGKQIDEFLFPSLDNSPNTTVKIDTYTGSPFAFRAIEKGGQAVVREYEPGDGYEFEPPLHKEKTPIDETLRDSVVAGVEANSPQGAHIQQSVRQIISGPKGFMAAMKMTRAKSALDVYLTGKFTAYNGDAVVKEIDYNRNGSLSFNVNIGGVDAQDSALKRMYDALAKQGTPRNNLAVIMGSKWFAKFESDTNVIEKRKATNASDWLQKDMQPPLLQGVEGLYVVGRYSVDGVAVPIWILVYEPDWPYRQTAAGASKSFMPEDQALMFNVGGMGYRCNRGIDVLSGGTITRAVGDMVIDNFTDSDPPVEWIRANARFMYLKSNMNHTCVATGTGL